MKILYLMFCDWNWVKQRPHYLAEELSHNNDVTVFYPFLWWSKTNSSNEFLKQIKYIKMFCIPKFRTNKMIKNFVNYINRLRIAYYVKKNQYDVIWVSHPDQFSLIKNLDNIVYDCMDNYSELEISDKRRQEVGYYEKEIINKSKYVFTSSNWLKNKIIREYGVHYDNVCLIRNAFNGVNMPVEPSSHNSVLKLCYFGTISEWFDWEIISESLKRFDKIEYHLYGPIASSKVLTDSCVFYHGIVNHDSLYEHVSPYDVLIMPFKVNQLIEAVDPVKLYEYINFNKNILTVYYDEINRFEDYVYFYRTVDEYCFAINQLLENNSIKYTYDSRNLLLNENTWRQRAECIQQVLKNI